jgi:NADP-dependent 3-hydroxy acid dehydrogenase YdfG
VKPCNIRTTVISPGAIATELPNSVTEPDIAEGVKNFYKDLATPAESFAQGVAYAMSQPEAVDIRDPVPDPHGRSINLTVVYMPDNAGCPFWN